MNEKQAPANHHEFLLVGDSFLFKFLVRLRLIRPDREPLFFRAIFLALWSWLPLLALSAMQGLAVDVYGEIRFYEGAK